MESKNLSKLLLVSMLALLLVSCTSKKQKQSRYFGQLPYIHQQYKEKKAELKKETRLSSSIGKTLELKAKIKQLEQDYLEEFNKEYAQLEFPIIVPVEGQKEFTNHSIQKIYIEDISPKGRVKLKAKAMLQKKDFCPFAFVRFADESGLAPTQQCFTILTIPNASDAETAEDSLKRSKSIFLEGYLNCIASLANAEKIILMTEDEYFAMKD